MFESNHNQATLEIEETVRHYIQGYLKAQSETLLKAFHPKTRLFSTDDGKLETTETSDWVKSLDERRKKGDIREAEAKIEGLDVSGDAAVAKVSLVFKSFQF